VVELAGLRFVDQAKAKETGNQDKKVARLKIDKAARRQQAATRGN
jgi:hypothetical protein